jgi:hypothetical protein
MSLLSMGKNLLKLVPGIGQAVTIMDAIGDVAEAVGGDTGKKIKGGLDQVTEGLAEADAQAPALTPEQRLALAAADHRHAERMRSLELADVQGGRDLAKTEILSQDEYVRRTRPKLLRLYGKAGLFLVFAVVAVGFAATFMAEISETEAGFLIEVIQWALGSIMAAFIMMYRAYTGKRTAEKAMAIGHPPEGVLDKLARLRASGPRGAS